MKKRLFIQTADLKASNIRSKGKVGGWRRYITLVEVGRLSIVPDPDLNRSAQIAVMHRVQEWNHRNS